ncbi:MAG: AarF/UbiB family protein [Crocinitomicaceae bacterium]
MGLFSNIRSKYRSFRRYNQILKVLVKYGFEDWVHHLQKERKLGFLRRLIPGSIRRHAAEHTKWEMIRLACEELGPTFIKFGQVLSNRPDLVPVELIQEFEKLQDNVPPMDEATAKAVVEKELNGKVEELFAWYEPQCFASASMSQVHNVTLKTGERVALKIQRPGIKKIIREDIKVMYHVAAILEKRIPELKSFSPIEMVQHFEKSINRELDFLNESINIQRFRNYLKRDESTKQFAYAPKVFLNYTTDKILAMEFISGIKISHFTELEEKGHDRKLIAYRLSNTFFKQIFEYGFFHADPHPGNLYVLPDGKICYLDFGMMGSILPRDIDVFGRLFISLREQNVRNIVKAIQDLTNNAPIHNMREFEFDVNEFVERYYVREVNESEMSTILMEVKNIIVKHHLKVPGHFFLFIKAVVTIEGVTYSLDPSLYQFEVVRPYLLKTAAKKLNPIKMAKKVLNSLYELGSYMEEFPGDLKNAIKKINDGQIRVDLTHKGVDPLVHTTQRIAKQIIAAFLISALIIASSLFIIFDIQPTVGGYSDFGIIGFIVAGVLAFGMLKNLRKGDHDDWKGWGG